MKSFKAIDRVYTANTDIYKAELSSHFIAIEVPRVPLGPKADEMHQRMTRKVRVIGDRFH